MGMCPQTEDLAARSITLGVGPAFDAEDCADIAAAIVKAAAAVL